ncbi:molybdopterin cofactor-binding domain-containing protein [Colwellia sp. RSH04]|uniref:molybdopterin cofactor-binding domain-containing protein n=1 Tax=Colwellia sp. RSH04 TaxID=2305464 RepID=UPI000E56785A|nr:molybdopterin cofactor-binding domain-containing protein [Colwellia sp. RSH04]RHW77857.1 xanthine dehydrogenase [Colwellia sp. RSH04]
MSNTVSFYLNGQSVSIENPSPNLLLIDYLRSPQVSLAGAKKGCGEGGCGACTVILSRWDEESKQPEHRSINSCLRAVCSLQGLSVTTVEGTGASRRPPPAFPKQSLAGARAGAPLEGAVSKHLRNAQKKGLEIRVNSLLEGNHGAESKPLQSVDIDNLPEIDTSINPVAYRLAVNNGSQCGYCSTGFVMNMSAFLANTPEPTKKQIEQAFDGNICRCTGYRPILTAMKTFAIDWSEADEANRMKLLVDDQVKAQHVGDTVSIPYPKEAKGNKIDGVEINGNEQQWRTPKHIGELLEFYQENSYKDIYLLHANTSYGVYTDDFVSHKYLVDISQLKELYTIENEGKFLRVGAGKTYTEVLKHLDNIIDKESLSQTTAIGALQFMAHRTAGTIIRNAASLGGNTMLVLKHICKGTGEPFPSDLFTVLSALGTELIYIDLQTGEKHSAIANELALQVEKDQSLANHILLVEYKIPVKSDDYAFEVVQPHKVALRDINAHSIVNSTSILALSDKLTVEKVNLTYGAIAPYPWRAKVTEKLMKGSCLSLENFPKYAESLSIEVEEELIRWKERMSGLKDEGFTDSYKIELATAFLYKSMVTALLEASPESVPENQRSAGKITWGHWPVSDGSQNYTNQSYKAPISQPYVKLMALYQTSGQVRYTHEMEVPPTTVNASFVQSQRALANFAYCDPKTKESPISIEALSVKLKEIFPQFIRLVTEKDTPRAGVKDVGIGGDQPVFAKERVSYVGQSIALAIAVEEKQANIIAQYISDNCIAYTDVDWAPEWQSPVLTLEDAIKRGSIFPDFPASAPFYNHIWQVVRNHSHFGWTTENKDPLDTNIVQREVELGGNQCKVIESTQTCGGQIHFYMETQSCVALPGEAENMTFHPSSQSPMEMHQTAAAVLGVEHNSVDVGIRQLGGGYGGKTEQAKFVIGATAVAAKAMEKPVRLIMPRANDTSMIGKRHPYYGQYQIAIDDGTTNTDDKGIIRGVDYNFFGDGGAFYDCSFIVSNCLQTRVDNAYMIDNFKSQLDVCRTNTAPNTAFRSFGDIQGKLISENAIDDAAFSIGMDPIDVREKNLYKRGDVTPYGQALSYCYMREVWDYLKVKSDVIGRRAEVAEFNKNNKWRKRGLYMLPVKYGSGYNLVQLEQASAMVSVYSGDGTIVINQGGVDMGQGMVTKLEQIAAYILNVPMDMIRIQLPKTDVIPNPTSTGGSTGTAYNGLAVKQTCEKMRSRLLEFGYDMLKEKGNDWCNEQNIDFWNYGEQGWSAQVEKFGKPVLIWQNLIALANQKRISLVETFNAKIPGGETAVPNLVFKTLEQQKAIPGIEVAETAIPGGFDSFCGFTYSAACSEVEVDILTGEVKIIRSDLMYDMGWSINPALDIGQVEGAFIQGVGYVMTEKLVFEPKGEDQGRLNTVNTWRYKPPGITNVPLEMNVHLFPRDKAENVPENPNDLLSAKEVGEPPLVLASSVFFAIKAAIRESRVERGLSGLFQLDAPATVQEVRKALAVDLK